MKPSLYLKYKRRWKVRLEWIVDFKSENLEWYFIVSGVIGVLALVGGIFFDVIAGKFLLVHQAGFGTGQVLWCFSSALYLVWTIINMKNWWTK
jgi:vacuolar-type H+-ATPase subunit I/STV1